MALIAQVTIPGPVGAKLTKVSVVFANVVASTAIDPGAAGGIVHAIEIDNTANSTAIYMKGWFQAGAPTIGTTAPKIVLKCAAGTKTQYSWSNGFAYTNTFFASALTIGGTAGTASADSTVFMNFLLDPN